MSIEEAHGNKYFEYAHILAIFCIYLRTISYMRIFEPTRYLIRMIGEVISGMTSFMVILIGSTLSFAVLFQKINDIETETKRIETELK